jgi:predicted permease
MLDNFRDDLRYSIRGLRRDPFLALAAGLTLAICIGANTTVFSIANSILIRPLPYPAADRIQWISERSGPAHQDLAVAPDYYRVREWNRVFEEVAGYQALTTNWTGVERPERLDAASVSASFFRVLGVQPMRGRFLAPHEEGSHTPTVVVLSYAFWRNHLGADPNVLGKKIEMNREPYTIIGVMPQGFDYPRGVQVWIPWDLDESTASILSPKAPIRIISIIARLKPGISEAQMDAELNRLALAVRADYPQEFRNRGFRADLMIGSTPLQTHLTGELRPVILILTGAVTLVLLIACVNLANLLLARASARRRELGVRLALGSTRGRLIRQMLTESVVLAAPGGVAGILLALNAVYVLNALKPAILVRYPAISIDARVLLFTAALTLVTSIVFGLAPAVSAAGIRIQEALKAASLAHSGSRGAATFRKTLVVGELAISLVLLIGAGLLTRSFLHLAHTELGFRSDHLLTFRVNPIGGMDRNYARLYADVLDRLKELPSVRSASMLADVPLNDEDFYATGRIRVLGREAAPFSERTVVNNTVVSPDFFRTLEIPLKSGRIFDAHDTPRSTETVPGGFLPAERVVVNSALVQRVFPGEDPIGKRLGFGPDERNITWTIVGVVGDVRGGALGADPPMMVYRCTCAGNPVFRAGFALRMDSDPRAAIRAIEHQVRLVDRDQPISDVKTMDERRDAALAPERFQLLLIGTFAAIAMLLAAAGVYGTMSYLIARRTREIGIRVAMGATPRDIARTLAFESSLFVILAVPVGLSGAWALTRYMRSMLFGVTEVDSLTFVFTPIVLAVVVMAACIGPARRAMTVDPLKALREE